MNRSGEEQDRFLQEVEEGMIKVAKKASLEQDNNGNAFTMLETPTKGETPVEVQDKRSGKIDSICSHLKKNFLNGLKYHNPFCSFWDIHPKPKTKPM